MTAKVRVATIRLAEKIEKNKEYARKVGVSVEIKCNGKKVNKNNQ